MTVTCREVGVKQIELTYTCINLLLPSSPILCKTTDLAACDAQKSLQNQLLSVLRLRDVLSSAAPQKDDSYTTLLSDCIALAYDKMKDRKNAAPIIFGWRRLYTEACLIHSLMDCITSSECNSSFWNNAVGRLDHAIVIAGSPGVGRLNLLLDAIQRIQETHLPTQIRSSNDHTLDNSVDLRELNLLVNSHQPIPCLPRPPSFSTFQAMSSLSPFVLRGHASHWPAIVEGRWSSKSHLRRVAGRGRVIPVEVGADYRTDTWTQTLMDWELFLDYLWPSETGGNTSEIIYLAQHNLFKQFPDLALDIVKPDYVYCSLDAPNSFPSYEPPSNEDQLVLNAWFGPAGTISPAHTVSRNDSYTYLSQIIGELLGPIL